MGTAKKLPRGISVGRSGRYRARVSFEGRQIQLGEYENLTHAKAALDKARGEIVAGTFTAPLEARRLRKEREAAEEEASLLFSQWADQWLTDLEQRGRSAGTLLSYRSQLNAHVLGVWAERRLVDITSEDVRALMDSLAALPVKRGAKGGRNGVVDNVGRTLRALFNAAVKAGAGGLTSSPFDYPLRDGRKARQSSGDDDVATPTQVAKLAGLMPEHLGLAVYLAAYCSLRIGEALGLNRSDFEDLEHPEQTLLHVRRQVNSKAQGTLTEPKWGSTRTVSVPASLVPLIVAHLQAHSGKGKAAPVFVAPHTGERATHKQLDAAWRKARDQVKPGFRFHDLRHTGLTLFAQQGATLAELLNRGGHSDVSVALRYQHASLERDRALTAQLSKLLVL